jgi:UDP-GlcNAc:undecaprenyl-phosphate GlcNAc-1-phosphate transferase
VQTLLGFILAMSVTMLLIPVLMRWAVPLRIVDVPDARKVHAGLVPRVGGIAMVTGVLLALLLWGASTRAMQALWVCIATLLVFGVWDDRKTLAAGPKFAGQALAALIAIAWGGVNIVSVTSTERMALPVWMGMPLAFLFLVGGTNAFNLADGLDGLAGGMATLCLCGTALLAYTVGNAAVGGAAVVMVGALVGFLRFNTHPARVFMGDGGSQVLGFSAALLALVLTQDPQIPLSTALPLLLLGMPIIDTLMVMTERLLARQSPFRADRRHIHYRLLEIGFEHWEAVSILYLLQGCLLVAAWFMRYDSDLMVASSFVAFSMLVVVPIRLAQHFSVRVRDPLRNAREPEASGSSGLRPAGLLLQGFGGLMLGTALGTFALWVLVAGAQPSREVRVMAVSLAGILSLGLILRWRRAGAGWTDKVALYSCAALAIFLSKHSFPGASDLQGGQGAHLLLMECILYPMLALSVVLCIRSSGDRPFRITPLDILVLLVVVTVPNLPDSIAGVRSLGWTIAELVLLSYSLEALTQAAGQHWRWLSGAAAAFLIGLALHPGV